MDYDYLMEIMNKIGASIVLGTTLYYIFEILIPKIKNKTKDY
jgi:hypothetical protein